MHAAPYLAVGMARFAVLSLLVLFLCILATKAQDSTSDLDDHYSGSGSGSGDYTDDTDDTDDTEEGDSEDFSEEVDPNDFVINWQYDEEFYNHSKKVCKKLPSGKLSV